MAQAQAQRQLSPAERANLFAQFTRNGMQPMAAQPLQPGGRATFKLPSTGYLHKIRLKVTGALKVTHATATSFNLSPFGLFELFKNIRLEMNNGFSPFTVTGKDLFVYSLLNDHSGVYTHKTSGRGRMVMPQVASAGGTSNPFTIVVDMPVTLNDRDPIGLIMLQNPTVVANLDVEINDGSTILASGQTGYTVALENVQVQPSIETFSIPSMPDARPDISSIKIVNGVSFAALAAGETVIKLPTYLTYRKLAFYVEDSNGLVNDSFLTGDIELVFNQNDVPVRIHPVTLSVINEEQFRKALPTGIWAFDFSYQGLANYGGTRDYIDTERLTEFWLRLKTSNAATVRVVTECISRLRG